MLLSRRLANRFGLVSSLPTNPKRHVEAPVAEMLRSRLLATLRVSILTVPDVEDCSFEAGFIIDEALAPLPFRPPNPHRDCDGTW